MLHAECPPCEIGVASLRHIFCIYVFQQNGNRNVLVMSFCVSGCVSPQLLLMLYRGNEPNKAVYAFSGHHVIRGGYWSRGEHSKGIHTLGMHSCSDHPGPPHSDARTYIRKQAIYIYRYIYSCHRRNEFD